jgi:hypothetical protein
MNNLYLGRMCEQLFHQKHWDHRDTNLKIDSGWSLEDKSLSTLKIATGCCKIKGHNWDFLLSQIK